MNEYLQRLENGEDAKVIILEMSEKISDGDCTWAQQDFESGHYSSTCGLDFWLEEGSPFENQMTYCPKCASKINGVPYKDEPLPDGDF